MTGSPPWLNRPALSVEVQVWLHAFAPGRPVLAPSTATWLAFRVPSALGSPALAVIAAMRSASLTTEHGSKLVMSLPAPPPPAAGLAPPAGAWLVVAPPM